MWKIIKALVETKFSTSLDVKQDLITHDFYSGKKGLQQTSSFYFLCIAGYPLQTSVLKSEAMYCQSNMVLEELLLERMVEVEWFFLSKSKSHTGLPEKGHLCKVKKKKVWKYTGPFRLCFRSFEKFKKQVYKTCKSSGKLFPVCFEAFLSPSEGNRFRTTYTHFLIKVTSE